MAQKYQKVRTANFARCLFDGRVIGLCQSVRATMGYGSTPLHQIGSIDPVENVPTRAVYQITVRRAVLIVPDSYMENLIPANGEEALEGLIFDIELVDTRTGEPLKKFIGCSYDTGTFAVEANQIIFRDASFRALTADGEGL